MPDTALASRDDLKSLANALRALAMDAVEAAKSGHPGMPMGMADVATTLFANHLRFDPTDPTWPDRDRFVLSAGHGSMLLYGLLHLTGYEKFPLESLKNFRQIGAITAGHPEAEIDAGVETTTGPLGQGISTAVGMALAERLLAARFGGDLVDHHTYVIASDGDLMEGVSHEACALAGHLQLDRLIVLYDQNGISIDGSTDLTFTEDVPARFAAYGWWVTSIDGHDPEAIDKAIAAAKEAGKPALVCCRTVIGFGAPTKAGKSSSHGAPLGADEIAGARDALNWPYAPFEIPDDIRSAWTAIGAKGAALRAAWAERHAASEQAEAFTAAVEGALPSALAAELQNWRRALAAEKPKLATRQASGKTLEKLVELVPSLLGGSADLTGSNNTKVKSFHSDVSAPDYAGTYVNYGVREHGMAAVMNGIALHGGMIPYSGTFLQFADYSRPAIRLAALMGVRVIHVMTHDSIGLGEDGPTHQPVEHMAALRAIPNLSVFRPADMLETAECWELALMQAGGPSVLALTRQGLPCLRSDDGSENLSAKGAYAIIDCDGDPDVVLLASGSEVEIAAAAADELIAEGSKVRVVSMPCWELFEARSADDQDALIPPGAVKVAVEAAVRQGWDRWIGRDGGFVGMSGFGASGPYKELYEHFGITPAAVAAEARTRLAARA